MKFSCFAILAALLLVFSGAAVSAESDFQADDIDLYNDTYTGNHLIFDKDCPFIVIYDASPFINQDDMDLYVNNTCDDDTVDLIDQDDIDDMDLYVNNTYDDDYEFLVGGFPFNLTVFGFQFDGMDLFDNNTCPDDLFSGFPYSSIIQLDDLDSYDDKACDDDTVDFIDGYNSINQNDNDFDYSTLLNNTCSDI